MSLRHFRLFHGNVTSIRARVLIHMENACPGLFFNSAIHEAVGSVTL